MFNNISFNLYLCGRDKMKINWEFIEKVFMVLGCISYGIFIGFMIWLILWSNHILRGWF